MKAKLKSFSSILHLILKKEVFIVLILILLGSSIDITHYELTHETKAPTHASKPADTSTLCIMGEKGCDTSGPTKPEASTQSTNSNSTTSTSQAAPQESNTAQTQPSNSVQQQQYAQEIATAQEQCTSNDEESITNYTTTVESYAADLYQLEETDSSSWNSLGQSEVNSAIVSTNSNIQNAYNGTLEIFDTCTPSTPVSNPPLYKIPSCNATSGSELQTCASQIYSQSGIP